MDKLAFYIGYKGTMDKCAGFMDTNRGFGAGVGGAAGLAIGGLGGYFGKPFTGNKWADAAIGGLGGGAIGAGGGYGIGSLMDNYYGREKDVEPPIEQMPKQQMSKEQPPKEHPKQQPKEQQKIKQEEKVPEQKKRSLSFKEQQEADFIEWKAKEDVEIGKRNERYRQHQIEEEPKEKLRQQKIQAVREQQEADSIEWEANKEKQKRIKEDAEEKKRDTKLYQEGIKAKHEQEEASARQNRLAELEHKEQRRQEFLEMEYRDQEAIRDISDLISKSRHETNPEIKKQLEDNAKNLAIDNINKKYSEIKKHQEDIDFGNKFFDKNTNRHSAKSVENYRAQMVENYNERIDKKRQQLESFQAAFSQMVKENPVMSDSFKKPKEKKVIYGQQGYRINK